MSPAGTALAWLVGIVGAGALIGFLAHGRRRMDLEQWTVGGRSFGLILVWLLMAGEIYTIFAFLGASGWAYSRGGPSLYILAYLPLTCVVNFWAAPHFWEAGRRHGLQTQADYFAARYGGRWLPALVALVGMAALVPYVELQLTGLGIIAHLASFGRIGQAAAMAAATGLIVAFVLAGGIRAIAGISVLKDLLMIGVVLGVGCAVPWRHFGGIAPMFDRLLREHPAHFTLPGATPNLGHAWYISTVLLCALGPTWPHSFSALFTAKSADVIRRNAMVLPLYNLTLPLVLFVGVAAFLQHPGLGNGDLSFMTEVQATFPGWILGVVGGTGALAGAVPAAVMLLTGSTLFAKNLVRPLVAPSWSDARVGRLAKGSVILLALAGLYLGLHTSATLVSLLQLGYGIVGQFAPGLLLGLCWRRTKGFAVGAGILTGLATLVALSAAGHPLVWGCNAGFAAVLVNTALTLALSALPRRAT